MSELSLTPTTPPTTPSASDEPTSPPRRFPLFLTTLLTGNLAIFLIWGSVLSLLMSTQIERIDPSAKVGNLALVSMIGAMVSVVFQPTWGMVSDRLRTRIGKRAPLLLLGAVLGGFSLILLGISNSLLWITLSWCAVQLFVNMAQAPLQAVIPDRVPRRLRGTTSTIMGLGLMGGSLAGSFYGAAFVTSNAILAGYVILAGILLLAMVLFVILNPEGSNREAPREPFRIGAILAGFWVSPRKHPDFFWTFSARFTLMLAYFGVSLYQLYIMQDYIGLGSGAASAVPLVALSSLAGSVVTMLICGPWSDRVGRRKPFVMVSSLILGIGLLIPFFVPTLTGMLLYGVVSGLGFGCYMAVDTALFTEVLPRGEDAGKDLGIANIASALPQVLAPAVAGAVVGITGGFQGLFLIALVLSVVGALCIIPIRKVR
ncbi:MFS transporter [Leifsonia shinshuensis]|uniref:MFS transporter n=1 Tax=Leifsonia shinshuensis TaxID=150026 RepID=UPI001F50D3E5|nr:MFS transporter [Leifsonia shinshuensis]MCI0157365.1 MFS transporter [Leifsonia shinshuensis]